MGAKRPFSLGGAYWRGTAVCLVLAVLYLVVLKTTRSIPVRMSAVVILGVPIVFIGIRTFRAFLRDAFRVAEEERKRNPKLR
jgi:hypothetical protein